MGSVKMALSKDEWHRKMILLKINRVKRVPFLKKSIQTHHTCQCIPYVQYLFWDCWKETLNFSYWRGVLLQIGVHFSYLTSFRLLPMFPFAISMKAKRIKQSRGLSSGAHYQIGGLTFLAARVTEAGTLSIRIPKDMAILPSFRSSYKANGFP